MRIETQNIHFTSDLHIGHSNVIRFDKRPFQDVNEMHSEMIRRWNSVVAPDDIVFNLGDLFFRTDIKTSKWFVNRLNGKIYHIMGNHDRYRDMVKLGRFEKIFGDSSALGGVTIQVKDEDANRGWQDIILCHYAILSWNKGHYGSWHLHGHSHQSLVNNPDMAWFYERKVLDMGCNGWDYTPVSYQRVKEIMDTRGIKPVDHHGG